MESSSTNIITKSDFLLYSKAPRHLWAKKHGQIEVSISDFDQHLAEEGNRVEALAQEFLASILLPQHPGDQLLWQQTYSDGPYESRLDGLVFKPKSNTYDLYEIKSSTAVDKDIVYDVTFQAAILEKQIKVDHFFCTASEQGVCSIWRIGSIISVHCRRHNGQSACLVARNGTASRRSATSDAGDQPRGN